ncbi:hypothetical protein [Rhodococcus opacus]|uniref:hypothetical protein n=1 Tax=Rhodococcus opacus TaxID=37919 RepID=UPI001F55C0B1|nr:hypothetical protein [Rhodococcus opacus]UNN05281.1 hypothetical protein MOO23_40895 [Rhodococcus opacus]
MSSAAGGEEPQRHSVSYRWLVCQIALLIAILLYSGIPVIKYLRTGDSEKILPGLLHIEAKGFAPGDTADISAAFEMKPLSSSVTLRIRAWQEGQAKEPEIRVAASGRLAEEIIEAQEAGDVCSNSRFERTNLGDLNRHERKMFVEDLENDQDFAVLTTDSSNFEVESDPATTEGAVLTRGLVDCVLPASAVRTDSGAESSLFFPKIQFSFDRDQETEVHSGILLLSDFSASVTNDSSDSSNYSNEIRKIKRYLDSALNVGPDLSVSTFYLPQKRIFKNNLSTWDVFQSTEVQIQNKELADRQDRSLFLYSFLLGTAAALFLSILKTLISRREHPGGAAGFR